MLAPWLELPRAADRLRWLSTVSGLDLIRLGTTADADEIRDTALTQPLLVATALAAAAELELPPASPDVVVAGHSVGELVAAALAGVYSPEAAVALARVRGAEMAAACALAPTGMSAVLGGDPDEVIAGIEALGLTAANVNGAGQVVAAGATDALEKLAAEPPGGAKVRPLTVAGAFHTPYMEPARENFGAVAAGVPIRDPELMLLSDADGTAVHRAGEVRDRLVRQIALPVRWDLCQATLRDLGVTAIIELPPAGTLAGIARRELRGVETVRLSTPEDLAAAQALVARTTADSQGEHTPDWRVVIAPAGGTFAGVLVEWLLEDGDLVGPGEPLARLVPGAAEEAR